MILHSKVPLFHTNALTAVLIIFTIKGEQDQFKIEILVRQWQGGQIE